MAASKDTPLGPGVALGVAAVLFLAVAINFPAVSARLFGQMTEGKDRLALAQLTVSIVGFVGAIVAFAFALHQYRRGESWKRTEFIAREVKEFESHPIVQNALLMIDWGERKINLHLRPDVKDKELVKITRDIQWKALLPHPLRRLYPPDTETQPAPAAQAGAQPGATKLPRFSPAETKIRDTYDVFLTHLDRFENFINSGLMSADEFRPFLRYWVEEITKNADPEQDAKWRGALLTYINFYGYTGVVSLFERFGKRIGPEGEAYKVILNQTRSQDAGLAASLEASLKPDSRPQNEPAPEGGKKS